MGIIVGKNTKIIVQGITGTQGEFHSAMMKDYGSNIAAGVTPGKGGETVNDIPVYNTVERAKEETGADASIIFVPAGFTKDAAMEAVAADMDPVVIITEGVPVHDSTKIMKLAEIEGTTIIGPNTPGIITPGETKLGIMPNHIFKPGNVGLVSRSGTLTYEIVNSLTSQGYGQSTAIGLGGDPIVGLNFIDVLEKFACDEKTEAVVLVGEIGGSAEEKAAKFIKNNFNKPAVAYVAGRTAPKGKQMGHAGAIVSESGTGTASSKMEAFEDAGVSVARMPHEISAILSDML
ncbi:MAG: succinate--CoA ligase subunit alpha [Thermoplasmata archaeon]